MTEHSGTAKKNKPWIRPRHKFIINVFGPVVGFFTKLRYHVQADRFEQGDQPYLILYNHQTPLDQFFPLISFRKPIYHVATEDIFSNGLISSAIRYTVAPIPIRKQTQDLTTMRLILRIVKEGGTIAIAPEGNRTYSGKTENIKTTIAHLAKAIHLPVIIYRIEGGYGVQPRWSDKPRKGSMHAYVSRIISLEELDGMSREELYEVICRELYVNEAVADGIFRSDHKAEYIERMVYVCPYCGLSEFRSSGNETECLTCHRKMEYHEDKHISGVGYDLPFEFANDWYEYQNDFVSNLDVTQYYNSPAFSDSADISEVIVYKRKQKMCRGAHLSLFGDRIEITGDGSIWILPFEEVTAAAVLGRNKLNIYHNNRIYQFRGDRHFNALKYVNFYYRYRNQIQGDDNGEFLGL